MKKVKEDLGDPLKELLSRPLKDRIKAVAKDVKTHKNRFAEIDAFDLAHALEVPQAEQPSGDWSFISYAEKISCEEYAKYNSPASEIVYLIEDDVPAKRFKELVKKSSKLDEVAAPKFNFLTVHERALLEEAISQEQLENNEDNGQSCIAHYWVGKRSDNLCFEATVEDDGSCIFLLTPYDKKEFVDLNNCLTDDW